MLQNPRKTLGFKKNMVYKIPPGGGGGKPYPASGLLGLYLMMLDPSVKFNMKLMHQELSIRNQKCDALDDDAMIPMCRPCFAGDLKMKAPES